MPKLFILAPKKEDIEFLETFAQGFVEGEFNVEVPEGFNLFSNP